MQKVDFNWFWLDKFDYVFILWPTLMFLSTLLSVYFSRLEKDYTTIKTKEMEEQVEIKVRGHWMFKDMSWGVCCVYSVKCGFYNMLFVQRLRTENRLLKQRIDTLEKVSASVFVTRATKQTSLPRSSTLHQPTWLCMLIHHASPPNDGVLSFTNWAVLVESPFIW